MGLNLTSPDHTALSRRNKDVEIPRAARDRDGPIHLSIDSAALEVL